MHHWPQWLILEDWTTTRSFLPWFSSSVPTELGGFLPIINLSFFLPPKWPCLSLMSHLQWLAPDGSSSDGPDPRWFDLWWLGPVVPNESVSSQLLPALGIKRQDIVASPACRSVFLLSSHWFRRFFIDPNLLVFPFVYYQLFQEFFHWLIICPVFLLSLPSLGWEVFYQRYNLLRLINFPTWLGCSYWSPDFPPQSPNGLGGFLPSYTHTYTYMFNGAHV